MLQFPACMSDQDCDFTVKHVKYGVQILFYLRPADIPYSQRQGLCRAGMNISFMLFGAAAGGEVVPLGHMQLSL